MRVYNEELAACLRAAFSAREQEIGFGVGSKEYLFLANYADSPIIEGVLYIVDGENGTALDESGYEYPSNPDLEIDPWRPRRGQQARQCTCTDLQ